MVGYSLFHTSFIFILLAFTSFLIYPWLIIIAVYFFVKKTLPSRADWIKIALLIIVITISSVSYTSWQHLTSRIVGVGPHASRQLIYAAADGDLSFVEFLLSSGISVDMVSSDGYTPLAASATAGKVEVVEYLVSLGADLNSKSGLLERTALANAAEMGHYEIVRFLISQGAKTDILDRDSLTAAEIARRNFHHDIGTYIEESHKK